ncbi:MAG TPA: TRAP transporter small permease [Hyphomicrobiaceae bacterium]|nr:TRAP transporter small permease [Hyphomicrobiaceae bacterium]
MARNQFDAGSWLDRALGAMAALLLFGLMSLTAVDVVSRYIFNWPLRGAFEITELLLLSLIFAGLPLASRAGEHVTLDFIDRALTPTGRRGLRRLIDLVCGLILLGLAWRVWVKAAKIGAYGDTTEVLRLPISPFVYVMALMVAVTAVVHFAKVAFPGPDQVAAPTFDPDKTSPT